MAKCIVCGKKLKFNEPFFNLEFLYWGDACAECHKIWTENKYDAAKIILKGSTDDVINFLNSKGFTVAEENKNQYRMAIDGFKKNANAVIEFDNENKPDELQKRLENERQTQKAQQEEIRQAKEKHARELSKIIITMGSAVEGYKINDYLGIYSGSVLIGTKEVPPGWPTLLVAKNEDFVDRIDMAREKSLQVLKEKCYNVGADAIVNIAFSYVTFAEISNHIGVIVNGTAVKLQPM